MLYHDGVTKFYFKGTNSNKQTKKMLHAAYCSTDPHTYNKVTVFSKKNDFHFLWPVLTAKADCVNHLVYALPLLVKYTMLPDSAPDKKLT